MNSTTAVRYAITRHDPDDDTGRMRQVPAAGPSVDEDAMTAIPAGAVWWAGSDAVWQAVTDLHRAGRHDSAVELARLLRWTEAQETTPETMWALSRIDV